ncbi:hypothetical protein BC827DRAFT_801933 [Russula dissimulans]|nr:hypothetical protein BC827DRAFT_801933 [Russula dissimulans]
MEAIELASRCFHDNLNLLGLFNSINLNAKIRVGLCTSVSLTLGTCSGADILFTPGPGIESILRAGQAFPRPRNHFQPHDPRARLQDNTNYSASDEKKDNSAVDEDRVDTNRLAISLASACNLGTNPMINIHQASRSRCRLECYHPTLRFSRN